MSRNQNDEYCISVVFFVDRILNWLQKYFSKAKSNSSPSSFDISIFIFYVLILIYSLLFSSTSFKQQETLNKYVCIYSLERNVCQYLVLASFSYPFVNYWSFYFDFLTFKCLHYMADIYCIWPVSYIWSDCRIHWNYIFHLPIIKKSNKQKNTQRWVELNFFFFFFYFKINFSLFPFKIFYRYKFASLFMFWYLSLFRNLKIRMN